MPDTNLPARRRMHPALLFIIVVIILLYLGLNAWIYFYGTKIFNFNLGMKQAAQTVSLVKEKSVPLPIPRPPDDLPEGPQEYTFTHGDAVTGPKIQKATVDPQTPALGGRQTVTLTVKNQSPVSTVSATLYTDSQQHTYSFVLIKGTATDGTWQGFWNVNDTYTRVYYLKFNLTSATGDWTGGMKFR